jgi:hypothetical protein
MGASFKTKNMDKRIGICESIIEDMKKDATDFDGKPFTGKTMGEYMGYHGAAIAALANVLKSVLEEKEAQINTDVNELTSKT